MRELKQNHIERNVSDVRRHMTFRRSLIVAEIEVAGGEVSGGSVHRRPAPVSREEHDDLRFRITMPSSVPPDWNLYKHDIRRTLFIVGPRGFARRSEVGEGPVGEQASIEV